MLPLALSLHFNGEYSCKCGLSVVDNHKIMSGMLGCKNQK